MVPLQTPDKRKFIEKYPKDMMPTLVQSNTTVPVMGGLHVGLQVVCLKNNLPKIQDFIQKKDEKKLMHKNDRFWLAS